MFPVTDFDLIAMNERACRAIIATGRTQREVAKQMGIDISIPLHKREPMQPTIQNIRKAAQIIGVSYKWLTTGIPETQLDFVVSVPFVALYGQNIITGNNNSAIEINGGTGPQMPKNKKNPCLTCKNRYDRENS